MPPKAKDTWTHCDMIDGKMICKYCQKCIVGEGIYRFKQHLAGIGGHVKPCGAPNEVIRHIRAEYLQKFETRVTEPIETVVAKFGSGESGDSSSTN